MPTYTYTPTDTWHNDAQSQQNADVSDATLLQQPGQYALDNLVKLTGLNTANSVRRIATVADLAALKALTTQRDQDYFALDSNKRVYQFDSGSAATADDYAIVQPTVGAGRYILTNAVPKSTTRRWVVSSVGFTSEDWTNATVDIANARIVCNGGAFTGYAHFHGLKAGDIVTGIELCGNANVGGGGNNIVATFYKVEADSGDIVPTVTNLGALTITAGTGDSIQTSAVAPLPITIPEGSDHDAIVVEIALGGGAPTTNHLYWVALNGTRSYITE